ncbi:MAG TPA: glycogen debranching N-terminal domain-containing protein [Solirubrobacteraceae bacterium]|nr:glycogen debranching N-terminal domain-containing protein [Solirubrobacteraceae bacterium]
MSDDPHSPIPDAQVSPLGDLTSLDETVVIKQGNLFAVSLRGGRMPAGSRHPLGVYYRDCRFLSVHELRIAGVLPRLLIASDELGTEAVYELTNPDLELPDGTRLAAQSLQLRLERRFAGRSGMHERLTIRSHHRATIRLPLELRLASDFEPMLAIRGVVDRNRLAADVEVLRAGLEMRVVGRDGVTRCTAVQADPAPVVRADGALGWDVELAPGEARTLVLDYLVHEGTPPPQTRSDRPPTTSANGLGWIAHHAGVRTDQQLFDRIVRRCLLDLWLLRSELGTQRYYAAGIPWYATLFGRDSLITATETLCFAPEIAKETLRLLAGRLGRVIDDERDEEPGKVIHELRVGEVAQLGETPLANYYGTVDATPLFLCLLGDYVRWSGDLALFHELRPQVDAALTWMDRFGDLDGDGLIAYGSHSPRGLRNQGWKDSHDGVVDEHGVELEPPIALIEAQGYALRAQREVALLLKRAGESDRADALLRAAAEREQTIERFWLQDVGCYSMALDGAKRASRAVASNQGHLLWSGAVSTERAARIRAALMDETMFSGWGIRTLAAREPAYNPVGYHTGSIWPHDNALIACGLRRYGFDEDFLRVFEGMLEAASQFANYRLPELFGGFARREYESPVPYPVACRPQAWSAGAIPYLLKWALGLSADGFERRLRVIRPVLPHWLTRAEVTGLRVADATIDLRFERAGGTVTLAEARVDGDAEVILELGDPARPLPAE